MMKLSQEMLADEVAMRAFYESIGFRAETTERAIKARRDKIAHEKKPAPCAEG
jgi:hypothetical protein